MKKWIHFITIICTIGAVAFILFCMQNHIFTDRTMMEAFVRKAGVLAPILFIVIQMVQVVVPIVPGGITCAVGVLVFGPWYGLLYNYVGIVAGSVINFCLARKYGQCLVRFFVKEETYGKYMAWLEKGTRFDKWFAVAIFFPCAPDDVLCMIAGLSNMSFQKFFTIIALGKPGSIALYSMALMYAGGYLERIM